MRVKTSFSVILLIFCAVSTYALEKTACNCKDAVLLSMPRSFHFGPTTATGPYNGLQEITTSDKNSEIAFNKEHNPAWYLLDIQFEGELAFEIMPVDTTNDYDFLLYPYLDSNFCNALARKSVKPVRSNICSSTEQKGFTGLSTSATQEYHKQGPGDPFSKSLHVRKGEKYMLVLDNVTPEGQGHTIYFHALSKLEINGQVVNADSVPLVADVQLSDMKGKTLWQSSTNAKGAYQIKAAVEQNKNYSLTFLNDSSFVGTETITPADFKDVQVFSVKKMVLPKLEAGGKYNLGNINFYPSSASILPQSFPSVEALFKLMERNKKMVIQVEGHVNAPNNNEQAKERIPGEFQKLSDERAAAIRDYLITKGISKERISAIGLGASGMLFPDATTEKEQIANRRVEIKVVSIR